jgi:hypothetical protein
MSPRFHVLHCYMAAGQRLASLLLLLLLLLCSPHTGSQSFVHCSTAFLLLRQRPAYCSSCCCS